MLQGKDFFNKSAIMYDYFYATDNEQSPNNTLAIQPIKNVKYTYAHFLLRVYQQAKQMSQIIAYIWRWIDLDVKDKKNEKLWYKKEVANVLKSYFEHPTGNTQERGKKLKELLGAIPVADVPSQIQDRIPFETRIKKEPGILLHYVFCDGFNESRNQEYIFPMFDEFELGNEREGLGYSFEINIESYHGNCADTTINHPSMFIHSIPFPPRPSLGEATVTEKELEAWIEDRTSNKFYAENPYIPTTST